ncbi:MAG: RagB/SusD family nutrient uptake outer membrane protein [Bacteroidota bacterium]|nr:RagB/SusD family nutrient uptake outer membrane protein [Bacteroidota bacterium]
MKSVIFNIATFLLLIAGMTSCNDDFLQQTRLDAVGTATYWNSRANVESNLAACYSVNVWEKWSAIRMYVPDFLRGDDCFPEHFVNWYGRSGNFTNNSSYEGSSENTIWEMYYKGIFYCNQVIAYTPNSTEISDAAKDSLIAEARFLRGFYHFELYKHFKNIIYLDYLPESLNELYPSQTPEADILTKLVADFTFAAQYLPKKWDSDNTGRATMGAAYGYLGKTYLWFKEYDKAATAFAEVDKLGYTLLSSSNWGKQFYGTAENSTESIFEIQFRESGVADNRYNLLQFIFTPYYWGEFIASDTLFNAFRSELTTDGKFDPRLTQSIAWYDAKNVYWKGDSIKGTICREGTDSAIVQASDIPYYKTTFEKYGVFWGNRASVDFYKSSWISHRWIKKYTEVGKDFLGDEMTGINVIKMRYADVLLMEAEALNEAGHPDQAVVPYNKVRKRSKMKEASTTISQADLRAAIRMERWKELAFEGHRAFDLRRWYSGEELKQHYINVNYPSAGNFQVNKHELLPIPLEDMQANPNLKQNPGY